MGQLRIYILRSQSSPMPVTLLTWYQILTKFLLACCFVAVFPMFSGENSKPAATQQQPGKNAERFLLNPWACRLY